MTRKSAKGVQYARATDAYHPTMHNKRKSQVSVAPITVHFMCQLG